MSFESSDLEMATVKIVEALRPFKSLAESMQRIDSVMRAQADLQLLEHYYSKERLKSLYDYYDEVERDYEDASEAVLICSKRSGDQRSYEQYAAAHGEAEAKIAFTSMEEASARRKAADRVFTAFKNSNPVIARVRARLKTGL